MPPGTYLKAHPSRAIRWIMRCGKLRTDRVAIFLDVCIPQILQCTLMTYSGAGFGLHISRSNSFLAADASVFLFWYHLMVSINALALFALLLGYGYAVVQRMFFHMWCENLLLTILPVFSTNEPFGPRFNDHVAKRLARHR